LHISLATSAAFLMIRWLVLYVMKKFRSIGKMIWHPFFGEERMKPQEAIEGLNMVINI